MSVRHCFSLKLDHPSMLNIRRQGNIMKRPIALVATFGLALIAAEAAFAQGYDCPLVRGNRYVPANIDRSAEYPDSYGLSECRDGVCPYAQHLAQQSRSLQSQPQRPWDSQLSPHRIPTGDWRDDRRPQTYDLRSDDRRPTNYDLRDSYSRNDPYRQPFINGSGSRYEQPRSNDRPQTHDRGLTSGPPATFDRSLTNSRAPMDDFQRHEHDGNCNHDHGPVNSTPSTFDRRPLETSSPRYAPQPRQPSPSQSRALSSGPPPLPPQQ